MKKQYYKGSPDLLARLLEEATMLGYEAEIVGDELVTYYGKQHRKSKKEVEQEKAERWSKRERNYGYTRG